MTVTGATYVTREQIKQSLDVAETARSNDQIDRAIASATSNVEGLLRRRFLPWHGVRFFDWPNGQFARTWRLWLGQDEVISVTSLVSGGVTIPSTDYFLEPNSTGPPYTRVEVNLASRSAFTSASTHQRQIAITGVFGYRADTEVIGHLASDLAADPNATASASWTTASFGVGDLVLIDSELIVIADRTMVDSTQDLQTPLDASAADVSVAVTSGGGFAVGETILLDSERMLVVDIAGNTLTVRRAWDGSVLASHTGSSIWTLTGVTFGRAQQGTTLSAHLSGAVVARHVVPPMVRDLALAYAVNQFLQENAGYARVAGTGENAQEFTGRGIAQLEQDARRRHGRQMRTAAV